MTTKSALLILKEHKALIDNEEYGKFYPWQQQATSYIRNFLGKDSDEYISMKETKFPTGALSPNDLKLLRYTLQLKMDQAINTLSKIGIYRVYHNFLCQFSNKELIYGIIGVSTAIFGAAFWLANFINR